MQMNNHWLSASFFYAFTPLYAKAILLCNLMRVVSPLYVLSSLMIRGIYPLKSLKLLNYRSFVYNFIQDTHIYICTYFLDVDFLRYSHFKTYFMFFIQFGVQWRSKKSNTLHFGKFTGKIGNLSIRRIPFPAKIMGGTFRSD